MLESLTRNLKTKDVEYAEYKSLRALSTVKIGGTARIIIEPRSTEELIYSLNLLRAESIPYRMVGRGSNILFPDGEYATPILRTTGHRGVSFIGSVVAVDSGVQLTHLAKMAASQALSGMEELSGIPGTVGGAVVGNAGAFGREISELLLDCMLYDGASGEIFTLKAEDLEFSYRHSRLRDEGLVLLSARFRLSPCDCAASLKKIKEYSNIRKRTQPSEPSLGSTFKRPSGGYASQMIDSLGLRGASVGGAKISDKHAGFIVNAGGATAKDYLLLSELARERVFSELGVSLEYEIERF